MEELSGWKCLGKEKEAERDEEAAQGSLHISASLGRNLVDALVGYTEVLQRGCWSRWQLSIYTMRREDFQASKSLQLACGERLEASNKASACELDCVCWAGDTQACSLCYFVSASLVASLSLVRESRQQAVELEGSVSLAGFSLLAPDNRKESG